MRLLVFAHKPPPHHGQSYMVQLLLEALGGDVRQRRVVSTASPSSPPDADDASSLGIECYHVDSRLSRGIEDIGQPRIGKLILALRYCLAAIGCRFRFGITHFYYVPGSASRAAVYRDWIVVGLCRPFFPKLIYHWHAVGLGDWLESAAKPWERWISRRLLGRPELSIVLGEFNRRDGLQLGSKRIEVVANGIPDPCPQFASEVLPRRVARAAARKKLASRQSLNSDELQNTGGDPQIFRVLFLGLCYREKGLFDVVDAVALASQKLRGSCLHIELTVAGTFWLESERVEFEERIAQPAHQGAAKVIYRGFVAGEDKRRLLFASDCLCFPTYYSAESFGLVLIEAMAFGLPLITTNWRMIPELLPKNYTGLVEPRSPPQIAEALLTLLSEDYNESLRPHFLAHFTVEKFAAKMKAALLSV